MSAWADRWRRERAAMEAHAMRRKEAADLVEAYRKTILDLQDKSATFSDAAMFLRDWLVDAERKLAAIDAERPPHDPHQETAR